MTFAVDPIERSQLGFSPSALGAKWFDRAQASVSDRQAFPRRHLVFSAYLHRALGALLAAAGSDWICWSRCLRGRLHSGSRSEGGSRSTA